ncbi:ADP-ribosylglycohydrolase family protein [Micromonospora sp. ATA51]|nr:ADP-ribosylglycohydrolase family protein [Micromonospora sp. ATA51]
MPLNAIQSDRVAGVLLAAACGDALGVPYEFQPQLAAGEQPEMRGGGLGPYAPGEYSDDTQMAMCIAEVSATGADLRSSDSLDRIAGKFPPMETGGRQRYRGADPAGPRRGLTGEGSGRRPGDERHSRGPAPQNRPQCG